MSGEHRFLVKSGAGLTGGAGVSSYRSSTQSMPKITRMSPRNGFVEMCVLKVEEDGRIYLYSSHSQDNA